MDSAPGIEFRSVGEGFKESVSRLPDDVESFFTRMARQVMHLSQAEQADMPYQDVTDIVIHPQQLAIGQVYYRVEATMTNDANERRIMGVAQQMELTDDFSYLYVVETRVRSGVWRVGPADAILTALLSLYFFDDLRARRGIINPHETDNH